MDKPVLVCNNIFKSFGKRKILNNISFELNKGDILGFIGPNGSGKTTTIKCILGLNSIDNGTVVINGYDIKKDFEKAIENIGAIIENPDLYMYLTGYQNLKIISNMYKNIPKERINEVIKLVKLNNRIHDKVSKYSLGMRQRLGIAQAILHKPNLLILDEPTNGLDPEGIKELRELLVNLSKKENMAKLISSHNLKELESFCNKICIIKNGKIIETNDIKNIKTNNLSIYKFEVDNTKNINNILDNTVIISKNIFTIQTQKDKIPSIIEKLIKNNYKIYEIIEEKESLEDAFLIKTGGNEID